MAQAGVASRRKCEELISEGRVTVNGKTVTQQGTRVQPSDHIKVDGKLLQTQPEEPVYILLNKPRKMLTAVQDDRGRPVVLDLLREVKQRVFPVGRLDWDTEGVLLLTNDGELAHQLTHPSFEVEKTYRAKVRGVPDSKTLERLRKGIRLDDGQTAPATVRLLERTGGDNSWIEIAVHEGRNRLVRRMCQAVGHPVNRLKRVSYGGVRSGALKPGQWRYLTRKDLKKLRRAIDTDPG